MPDSADKYLHLVAKLQRREALRTEIAQYQAYRRLGCRSLADVKARLPDPTVFPFLDPAYLVSEPTDVCVCVRVGSDTEGHAS